MGRHFFPSADLVLRFTTSKYILHQRFRAVLVATSRQLFCQRIFDIKLVFPKNDKYSCFAIYQSPKNLTLIFRNSRNFFPRKVHVKDQELGNLKDIFNNRQIYYPEIMAPCFEFCKILGCGRLFSD